MAAINFPDSPTVNDEFSVDGRTWRWTGVFWEFVGSTLTQTALDGKLNLSGGTMTGVLTLFGIPTIDQHAASKIYVDDSLYNINNNLEQVDSEILSDISTINTSIDTIEESVLEVEGDISAINTSIDTIQDSIVTVNSNADTLSSEVQTVAADVTALEINLESLTTDVGDVSTAVTDLETDLAALADIVDLKPSSDSPTFTGTVVLPVTTSVGTVTSNEIGHLSGVTSSIQDQIDNKLDSGVASGIYAPLNNPTFGGTVSLPSTTSIGNVSSIELGYLDGVTSSVQAQLTDLDTTKADLSNPTFTGTVSGVTKTHVGLSNVDNTSDINKPISTATQTALNAKANLSSANFTGNVEVDGNMVVDGNLTVNGTEFIASATSITIEDNLIQIAHQNTANTVDLGLVVGYNDGTSQHSGIVRDVSANTWKLFKGVETEPSTTVNFSEGSLDDLELNNIKTAGIVFTDGTQTKVGVPSLTTFTQRTANYTLDTLSLQDNLVEMNSTNPTTFTIPTDAALAWPIGASMDILQTNTGEVTIAAASGVTLNRTPGNKLRTQWSSATILKRGTNSWILYGDLKA
jgi:prefoldin subunit 5